MDAEAIRDLFREFGPVDVRRMFGGKGIFVDGLMIALITSDDAIYLKADPQTIPAFKAEKLRPFTYQTKSGRHTLTSYWRMPDRLYDDAGDLAVWARVAHGTALRAAEQKRKASRAKPARKKAAKKKAVAPKKVRRPSRPPAKRSRPRGRSRT